MISSPSRACTPCSTQAARRLRASEALPAELLSMFARERLPEADPQSGPALRSWSVAGREWRGAAIAVLPEEAHLSGGRWTVIVSVPTPAAMGYWEQAAELLPVPVLLAALMILALCSLLRARWEPALEGLREALRRNWRRAATSRW